MSLGVPLSAAATAVWSLAAILLLTAVSPPLQACDNGIAVPNPASNPGLVEDCKVLLGLRDQLAGNASLNWDTGLVITKWQGISVPESLSRVSALILVGLRLTGEIPAELGQLSQLHRLWLQHNQLTGEIPVELAQLSQLRELYLGGNQLTGEIPAELGQLSQLYLLSFGGNQLTGEIPVELAQLSQLQGLELDSNQLSGVIPVQLGRLAQLQWLDLSHNHLTGPIPVEFGRLARLRWSLLLDRNQLTGEIPAELGQLSQLERLHLQHNQLTGPIPTELGLLSNLEQFSFRGNRLTGLIPQELRHLPDVYVRNLDAVWVGPGRMKVTWDDPGDPTVSYEYRLRLYGSRILRWTDRAEIEDPETTLRAGEGVTIEWTLTGLPTDVDVLSIKVRASNRNGSSPETLVAVRPLELEPLTTLYFPHYADGEGWSVQLAVSHIAAATEDAAIVVTAYDREGQPIPGFFDPDGPFEIPPLGTQVFRSVGAEKLRMGWIEVQSDSASVSGLLTFRHAATGLEVSVEPVKLGRQFALFVEETSVIGTGLAIFKPTSSRIEFRIRDEDGINPLGESFATAGDFNQDARTIPEWFAMDGIDTEFLRNFRGVLFLRAEDGSLFAPLGLRFGRRGESLSAVPVIQTTVFQTAARGREPCAFRRGTPRSPAAAACP